MRSFVLAAAAATTLACSKPTPPTLAPESVSVTQLGPQGIDLNLRLTATNANSVDLPTREVTAHIVVDKRIDLGTVTLPKPITLPAGKATKFDIPIAAKWNDVGSLLSLAMAQGSVPYAVDGVVMMGGDLVHVSLPFHLEGTVSHEQIVQATMRGLPQLPLPH